MAGPRCICRNNGTGEISAFACLVPCGTEPKNPRLPEKMCHAPRSLFRGLSALIWIPVIVFMVLVFYLLILAIQALKKYLGK